ncbi:putative carbonic anhydrase 3 [Oratosquilla oratoria]|uniref:putative carbonic anhydrase 3 n=1 Tax=Oratosquilla oratoria TaxID=337810 RepID=UPI003F75C8BC
MSILNKTYTFVQLHFHWGEYDDLGSEHTVDGEAFPLEIHFVHQSKDGSLAVLGVFADIDDEYPRDSVLYPLWDEFVEIEEAGDKLRLKKRDMIVIDDFLPDDLSSFYRYIGSTTTPPCLGDVTWTIFKTPVAISAVDVALLRTWRDINGELLLNNYRPIQKTGNRTISFHS